MNNICTSLEQSKKLIELGIDKTTADMYYSYDYNINEYEDDTQIISRSELGQHFSLFPEDIPAWSLSALLELIPKHIKQEDGRTYTFHIFNDDGIVIKRWGCSYCAEDFHNRAEYLSDPHLKYPTNIYSDKYDNPLDAVFEMVCWLLENKKL